MDDCCGYTVHPVSVACRVLLHETLNEHNYAIVVMPLSGLVQDDGVCDTPFIAAIAMLWNCAVKVKRGRECSPISSPL